jgi:RHS repeat-associated protein
VKKNILLAFVILFSLCEVSIQACVQLTWKVSEDGDTITYSGSELDASCPPTDVLCQYDCVGGVWTRKKTMTQYGTEAYSWYVTHCPLGGYVYPWDVSQSNICSGSGPAVQSLIENYNFEGILNICFGGPDCVVLDDTEVEAFLENLTLAVADIEGIPMSSDSATENELNPAKGVDPVFLSNGEYDHSATDVVLPGRGLAIVFTRSYGSRREYNGRLGFGWDMNYNMKVRRLDTAAEIIFMDGRGNRRVYEQDAGSPDKYIRASDRNDYILSNGVQATYPYELITKSGTHYKFDANGNLVIIQDSNGNTITLEYDASPTEIYGYSLFFQKEEDGGPADDTRYGIIGYEYKLRHVYDELTRELVFEYDDDSVSGSGLLTKIIEKLDGVATGRDWIYEYDYDYNNLRYVKGPEETDPVTQTTFRPTTEYVYEDSSNPGYPSALRKIYDPVNSAKAEQDKKPYLTNFYYNPLTPEDYIYPKVDQQFYGTDENGEDSLFEVAYDTDNNRGLEYSRQRDSSGVSKTVTVTAFNAAGQTANKTLVGNPQVGDPAGTIYHAYTTSYEYNANNETKLAILPKRNCVAYQYDARGNIEKIIQRPECDVLPFNGNSDYIEVDDSGLYSFNSTAEALEDFSFACWVKRLRSSQEEILLDKRDASGDGWCVKFDSADKVVCLLDGISISSTTEIADSSWHYIVISINRDGEGSIYIDGGLSEGNVAINSELMEIDSTTKLSIGKCSYAASNYFQGALDEVMILNKALFRDKANKYSVFSLSKYTQGLVGYWKMDDDDASTTVVNSVDSAPDGMAYRDTEDMVADGKVSGDIKVINTYIQHNDLDYLDTTTDPKGNVTEYTYDFEDYPGTYSTDVGNLMKVTYPAADYYEWDIGSLITDTRTNEVTFTYNAYGQIETMTGSDDLVIEYQYYDDPINDDPEDYGRLKHVIVDPSGVAITTEYKYDAYGHMDQTINDVGTGRLNIATKSFYNALDQLVEAISPLNSDLINDPYYRMAFKYNKNGKLERAEQKFLDGQSTPAQQTQTVEYEYNLLDALKMVRDSLSYETESFFDDNENLVAAQDAESKAQIGSEYYTNMEYDERDFLSKAIDAEGHETTYEYDANGNLWKISDAKNQVTEYTYDNFDRLVETKYPDTTTEEASYDASGNIVRTKTRAGDEFHYDFDALNRLTRKITDEGGSGVLFDDTPTVTSGTWSASDVLGEYSDHCVASTTATETCEFNYTVAAGDYVVYLWWPNGDAATAANNAAVNLNDTSTTTVYIDQTEDTAQWNNLGTFTFGTTVTIEIAAQSGKTTYADAVRLVPASLPTTAYYYDIAGRILRVDEDSNLTDYFYDSLGRLEDVIDQESRAVSYNYDNLSRRTQITYPDDARVEYVYDAMSRLTDIKYDDDTGDANPAVILAHYDYDELSRRKGLYYNYDGDSLYNEANVDGRITYDYEDKITDPPTNNSLGNRIHYIDQDINNDGTNDIIAAYTYDKVGNVKTKSLDGADPHLYLYDNIYQLTEDQDTQANGDKYNWFHNVVGNWLQFKLNDTTQTEFSTYDSTGTTENLLNQYSSVGPPSPGTRTDYTYDDNGNLTNDGTRVFVYDAHNRLLSVGFGDTLCEYTYDAAGRRISKKVTDTTGPTVTSYIEYCYDGDQVIAEYVDNDFDGDVDYLARKFIYGPGIDEPICMMTYNAAGAETGRYWYHFDALGSVMALSQYNSGNGDASIVERYEYSAFGETIVCDGNGTPRASNVSDYGNPTLFTGRRYDPETATATQHGLYYYRARVYSPESGRFLQPDPIGYVDSMNIYAYCGNNPIGLVDPMGLCKDDYDTLVRRREELLDYIASAEEAVYQNIKTLELLHSEKHYWQEYYKYVLYTNTAFSAVSAGMTGYSLISGVRGLQASSMNLGIQGGIAKDLVKESMSLRSIVHETEFFLLGNIQVNIGDARRNKMGSYDPHINQVMNDINSLSQGVSSARSSLKKLDKEIDFVLIEMLGRD